jgi:hypothetical protein
MSVVSQDERYVKILIVVGNFQFWSKFLSFKGVSPRKE